MNTNLIFSEEGMNTNYSQKLSLSNM